MTDTDWTRGVVAGAVSGGVGWGLVAVDAVGTAAHDVHVSRLIGTNCPVVVVISLMFLVVAGVLPRAGAHR